MSIPPTDIHPTDAGSEKPLRAADRILQSARELFYRDGIRAVGVDEIVNRAGVTKPSLYRSFSSKDELAASYLRLYQAEFWTRFEAAIALHPGDPRKQILEYLTSFAARATKPDYRGCGLSNAGVEYPEPEHPARLVSEAHKRELRQRLRQMAGEMGAADPAALGDGLLLLIEGTFITGQIFHGDGPATSLVKTATLLIDASVGRDLRE
ncbi:MAG TPA: TetR/AcrR family transcriptional regulator [Arsenicitalea sp.]|jgi:AcrR family transcriptional regulator|nr:TetR/AcrR family transcriptional regulator [Arsenicitalea sp.]